MPRLGHSNSSSVKGGGNKFKEVRGLFFGAVSSGSLNRQMSATAWWGKRGTSLSREREKELKN